MKIEQKIELLKDKESELVRELCIQALGKKRALEDNKQFYRTLELFIWQYRNFQGAMFLMLNTLDTLTNEVRDSVKTYIVLLNYLADIGQKKPLA